MSQFTQVRAFPCILSFSSILEHPQQIKSWLAPMSSWNLHIQSFLTPYLYVFVCVAYVCGPYICACPHLHTRSLEQDSCLYLSLCTSLPWDKVSWWTWQPHPFGWPGWLASKFSGSACLSLRAVVTGSHITWVRTWTQVFMLREQAYFPTESSLP